MNNGSGSPLVSICCLTYNHAPFIRECLEGFLMQEAPEGVKEGEQWMEILIHDDCSTDGTDEILREYEARYPGVVLPLYETENQYAKGGAGKMDLFNYRRARGKYIAYCEGDDYWTDPQKLRKQVAFMEAHPDYASCFTRYRFLHSVTGDFSDDNCGGLLADSAEGVDISVETYLSGWYTQALTVLFRREASDLSLPYKYKYFRDFHEYYHLVAAGKCRLMNFCSGVYRLTGEGIYTTLSSFDREETNVKVNEDLYRGCRDPRVRAKWLKSIQYLISAFARDRSLRGRLLRYSFRLLLLTGNLKAFAKNIKRLA